MCVPMALCLDDGNDRDELFLCLLRIKFWVLILLLKGLDNLAFLSYNTTPAEEGWGSSLLFAAWFFWPHSYHLFSDGWPHVAVEVFLRCSRYISFLPAKRFSSASTTPKSWPHINHSVLGFDHIFDHKQNRSTRRQECTRVWKSRFCVAESLRKAKTTKKRYINRLG